MAHFNAKCHNNQLELEITQLSKIFDASGVFFTVPMRNLVNKYADIFTTPSKPIAQDIKHKTEF